VKGGGRKKNEIKGSAQTMRVNPSLSKNQKRSIKRKKRNKKLQLDSRFQGSGRRKEKGALQVSVGSKGAKEKI